MKERAITQNPWSERPEQSDATVAALEALGFYIQLDFMDKEFEDGVLVSETFTKGRASVEPVEKVTVDYTYVRTYLCGYCRSVCLVADLHSHKNYHVRKGDYLPRHRKSE